jgi:D-glycero-D-manno-heptose 1,7-bisphosphate phosphatase
MIMQPALFLDLDGTVRETKSGKPAPNKPEDQVLMKNSKKIIKEYKRKGYKIVAVTNQGGIGLGHLTDRQCQTCLFRLDQMLDGVFDKMLYCSARPGSNDRRRKPNPGMLEDAAKSMGIDLKTSIMVGDRDTDQGAAKAAGVPFEWADDFFQRS